MNRKKALFRLAGCIILATALLGGMWVTAAPEGTQFSAPGQADPTTEETPPTETPTEAPPPDAPPTETPLAQPRSAAQQATEETPTEEPTTSPPPLTVTGSEPGQLVGGSEGTLSVFGTNFTASTTVRLVGYGLLNATLVNSGALTAALPAIIPAGTYGIEVSDPVGGSATSPGTLTILPRPTTPAPTERPTPTLPPPTPIPGQPSLIVRSYNVSPGSVAPGGTVAIVVDVYNQGNYAARSVALMVDSGGSFVPSSSQASVILPDIGPGGSTSATLTVIARSDAPSGTTTIPVSLTYRDSDGSSYSASATLAATIQGVVEVSQLTLSGYAVAPSPAIPGEPVSVTVQISNSGNRIASQVLLRIPTGEGVLLAGPQGDSFPLGSIAPGTTRTVTLPLIASQAAEAGPQNQSVTITYFQEGESAQVSGSMTISMAERRVNSPLLLLSAYDTGKDVLQPGDRFTLAMTLQNVGTAPVSDLIVLFSAVETENSSGATYTTFAPQGAGGTIYVGDLGADGMLVELRHDFVVDGTVSSGIYNLPIRLRYRTPDGTEEEDFLQASLVVVQLPRLQFTVLDEPPERASVGESFPLTVMVANIGAKDVDLTVAEVSAQGGEVIDGAETFMGTLRVLDDTDIEAEILPTDEGELTVTLTLRYLDDLNRERFFEQVFATTVLPQPTPVPLPDREEPGLTFVPLPREGSALQPPQGDLVGRLLLGLLGLGS